MSYDWPGNIRELENVIHHTLLVCRNGLVQDDDLRLSHLRIERQDKSPVSTAESAEEQLLRAFQRLFEEQAGSLHEKVEDTCYAVPIVSATATRCTRPACWV